jgi:phosphatidate cytidylyltransferase
MPASKTILTRVVFGAIMIAAIGGVLTLEYLSPWPDMLDMDGGLLTVVIFVLCLMGLKELKRMTRAAGAELLGVSATLGALAIATLPIWRKFFLLAWPETVSMPGFLFAMTPEDIWCMLGLLLAGVFLEQMIRHRLDATIARVGATVLTIIYLGAGGAIILTIRLDQGVPGLILFLVAVKFTDMGAYFTGSAIGRHKLIPWLSPGKSWEGLIGGLGAAAGASVLVAWLFDMPISLPWAAGFGIIVGACGQFADLCESLLKRSAKIKDSGSLVPEFGGVLDVLDSPLLAAPAAYVLLNVLI